MLINRLNDRGDAYRDKGDSDRAIAVIVTITQIAYQAMSSTV
jgi:hypothetical protein